MLPSRKDGCHRPEIHQERESEIATEILGTADAHPTATVHYTGAGWRVVTLLLQRLTVMLMRL